MKALYISANELTLVDYARLARSIEVIEDGRAFPHIPDFDDPVKMSDLESHRWYSTDGESTWREPHVLAPDMKQRDAVIAKFIEQWREDVKRWWLYGKKGTDVCHCGAPKTACFEFCWACQQTMDSDK